MVIARTSGLFLIAPIFGSRAAPPQIRLGVALMIAIVLAPLAGVSKPQAVDIGAMITGITGEFMFGLALGFSVQLLFSAVQAAGQVIDLMIGFAMANVIDPMSNLQVSIIGQLYNLIAVLVFFAVDGHHMLIEGLARSFALVPLGAAAPTPALMELLIRSFSDILLVALQIAAPIIGAMLVTDFFLALMTRAMPRMNVFFVGFPIRIAVGLIFIGLSTSLVVPFLANMFSHSMEDMGSIIAAFARG